jgi:hypothetical protein
MKMKFNLLLLSCLLWSCSSELRVYTDFDHNVSIQRLTRYNWLQVSQIEARNNPLYLNELTDKRVKAAVNAQLREKGYVLSDTAELIVHYHLAVENKTSVRPEPFGYNYGHYWIENELDTYRYREGTLIVDFMDSRNCELIWRGWAVSVLEDEMISEEMINKAVAEIFKKFPMSAAREVTLP